MKCYKCHAQLSGDNVCPQCGADVSLYKKAVKASAAYYNKGLLKAQVRDLSGAIESLKMSITINKNNIEARNLLGLVYCETGEVVQALSEWVMSKNLCPEDNIAGEYIEKIQSNQTKFEMVTTMIKKYNLSLRYAKEGNYDMALIQLKKVTSSSPNFIKAHQLLALLYIKDRDYQRARRHLNIVLKIDAGNTLARLYISDIEAELAAKKKESKGAGFLPKKKAKEEQYKPLSGNDVIIPRASYKEPSNGAITVINILAGVVIGAALIWFLITPARYKGLTEEYNKSIKEYSEQLSNGNVEINSLNKQVEQITADKEALEERLSQISGDSGDNKLLTAVINAANLYIADDKTSAAVALLDVDVSSLPTDEAKSLYNTIASLTMSDAATALYNTGRASYRKSDYNNAADSFVKSFKCDSAKVESAYYAAKSYEALNNTEEAKKYFQYIVDEFVTSSYYGEAKTYTETH